MPSENTMKPGGFYNAHSAPQRDAIDAYLPWLLDSIENLPIPSDRDALRTLDVGSSQGANEIHVLKDLLPRLREFTQLPLQPFFSDLPSNDFTQVFANLYPHGKKTLPTDSTFPAAVAGSAYEALMPAASVQIITSFNMLGWRSRVPDSPLSSFVVPVDTARSNVELRKSIDSKEAEPFYEIEYEDLRTFYLARAKELVPGGKLLAQTFGSSDELATSAGMFDGLSDAMLTLIDKGIAPESAYNDFTMPVTNPTVDRLIKPIDDDEELLDLFSIDMAECKESPVGINLKLDQDGDVTSWANEYSNFVRAFTENVMKSQLHYLENINEVVEQFYRTLTETYASNPNKYRFSYQSAGVLLTRK